MGSLLSRVHSPKIHTAYGKVMEREKKYKQAGIVKFQDFLPLQIFFLKFFPNDEEIFAMMFEVAEVNFRHIKKHEITTTW